MKKIEAVVRLSQFDRIRDALAAIGVKFFTMTDVKGFGLQTEKRIYRGSVYDADFIARLQIDILAEDSKVPQIVETIVNSGRTGKVGDGKITVLDVSNVVRIRTGETGQDAV